MKASNDDTQAELARNAATSSICKVRSTPPPTAEPEPERAAGASCLQIRPTGLYRNKVVRDLAWAISTPSMLAVTDTASAHIMGDAAGKLLELSQDWLLDTDERPRPLLAWMSRRRRVGRVLSYFTSLLEFWLTFCPFGMETSELFPTLNRVEGSALQKQRCKNCERPAAPGLTSGSKPWETCCRNCARKDSGRGKGPSHTAQCEFRKNSGITSTEGMWSADELVGKRASEVKVPLRQVVEAQALGSHATRRSVRLGQLSLVARVALRWRSDNGALLVSDVVVHIEPGIIFAADVKDLLPSPAVRVSQPKGVQSPQDKLQEPEVHSCVKSVPKQSSMSKIGITGQGEQDMDACEEDMANRLLCTYVSADLDSNLWFRLMLGRHCLAAAHAPDVQAWIKQKFPPPIENWNDVKSDTRRVKAGAPSLDHSSFVAAGLIAISMKDWVKGTINLPPALESGRAALGWWCTSAQELVQRRPPHSRFAVTERRHFLGPTHVCCLRNAKYGMTRGLDGKPVFIPVDPVKPPTVVDGSLSQPALQERDESDRVVQLQFCLVQLGDLRPSGIRFHAGKFGRNTSAAVRRVQARHGMPFDTKVPSVYDQATSDALRRDFEMHDFSTGPDDQKWFLEGQLDLLIPYEPLLTGPELIRTTEALQVAATKAALAPPPGSQPGGMRTGREFDDWWASVQHTAGQEADTRFLQNGDIPLWRELEESGHTIPAGSLGMLATTWEDWWMQRPYEILEFQPFDSEGNALPADVDPSSFRNGLQWRESSRGLILPGRAWQNAALDLARFDAPVNDKDSRGRPISWLAPHNHMLPALAKGAKEKFIDDDGRQQPVNDYKQWCVLDEDGTRQKRKSNDERWKTTQLVKNAPALTLPKKLNGVGLVQVVQKWFVTAGFRSLSSLHSGSGRQILAEGLASCTAPASLVVDAVQHLTMPGDEEYTQPGKKKTKQGLDFSTLAHVLVSALLVVPTTQTNARKCHYAGASSNGAERIASLLTATLARSADNESNKSTQEGSYGLGTPHSGTDAAAGLALLRLLMKTLDAVKATCPSEWAACNLTDVRSHASSFLARRMTSLQNAGAMLEQVQTDEIDTAEMKRISSVKKELGRGLAVAVALVSSVGDGIGQRTLKTDGGEWNLEVQPMPQHKQEAMRARRAVPWFASDEYRHSVRVIIRWLATCGETGTAATLASDVDEALGGSGEKIALLSLCAQLGLHKDVSKLKNILGTTEVDRTAWTACAETTRQLCLPGTSQQDLPAFMRQQHVSVYYANDASAMRAALQRLESYLQQTGSPGVVGVDCEWRPYQKFAEPEPVSLLQVALPDSVELLDLIALTAPTDGQHEIKALRHYIRLIQWSATVVGFGLTGDFKRLFRSYPQLFQNDHDNPDRLAESRTCLCAKSVDLLLVFSQAVLPIARMQQQQQHSEVPAIKTSTMGLDKLTRLLLDRKLPKGEQTSDWGLRPLSSQQLEYAANDAAVLLPLAAAMVTLGGRRNSSYTILNYDRLSHSAELMAALGGVVQSPPPDRRHGSLRFVDLGLVGVVGSSDIVADVRTAAESACTVGTLKMRYFSAGSSRMLHWYNDESDWRRFAQSARKKHRIRVDVVTPIGVTATSFAVTCAATGASWLLQADTPEDALLWQAALRNSDGVQSVGRTSGPGDTASPFSLWSNPLYVEDPRATAVLVEQEQMLGPTHVALALKRRLGQSPPLFELDPDCTDSISRSVGTHVKTLVLQSHDVGSNTTTSKLFACVLALHQRLSLGRCAAALNLRRVNLRLVSPHELIPLCGYPRGGIGPVGWSATNYVILVDDALLSTAAGSQRPGGNEPHQAAGSETDLILCGAGRPNLVFPICIHTLVDSFAAMVAPISVASTSGGHHDHD